MEGEEEGSLLGGQWKVKEKSFSSLPTFSPKPSFFPFDLKILLYHGYRLLFTHLFLFPWLINYDRVF
jgi:hypothetical protein